MAPRAVHVAEVHEDEATNAGDIVVSKVGDRYVCRISQVSSLIEASVELTSFQGGICHVRLDPGIMIT